MEKLTAQMGDVVPYRSLDRLQSHPLNIRVYGKEKVDKELIESMKRYGVLVPLIVDRKGTIISGHRRALAAAAAGVIKVPRLLFDGDELEIQQLLIESNRTRIKTKGQIARETTEMFRIEKEISRRRKTNALGKTTKVVAKKTGQSHSTVEKQVALVTAAESGDKRAISALERLDNNDISFASAHREIAPSKKLEWTALGTCVVALERVAMKLVHALPAGSPTERSESLKRIKLALTTIEKTIAGGK